MAIFLVVDLVRDLFRDCGHHFFFLVAILEVEIYDVVWQVLI